jgi:anti-sigma factor RsiW
MSNQAESISDQDLHAYVDGELSEQRRLAVEAWLASHPEAVARVRDYQSLRDRLHERFDPALAEPVELPVDIGRDRGPVLARAAAFSSLLLISGLLGWTLKGWSGAASSSPALADLVQPAAFAHQVYSTDTRYPVEITALEQGSLNRWLSQRMHTELRAPDLAAQNLQFIGGRLLPSTNRMAAQFMYEDKQGQRLTVYVRRITAQQGFSDFQYREQGDLHMFYWIDKAMGYAVIGGQPAARLIDVANAVHAAMETTTGRE